MRVPGPRDPTEAEKGSLGQGGFAAPWQLQTRLLLAEMALRTLGAPSIPEGGAAVETWARSPRPRPLFSLPCPGQAGHPEDRNGSHSLWASMSPC